MEMIKRVFKGISGIILVLVIGIGTLNQAFAQCTVEVFVTQNPSNCFSQVVIGSSASEPVQNWAYYIDGNLIGTNSSEIVNLDPGTYVASVVVITTQNCTAVDDFSFTVAGTQPIVDAGADVLACQESPLLSVSVSSSNPYSIQWTPANLLSNSTIASPQVIQNVTNQWFIVDVMDDVTGCISSDTVYVTQQNPLFDTLSLCNGPVTIDLGPGAQQYNWLSFTDTAGNNTNLNYPITQQAIVANEPGGYFMYADFPECGALTSSVVVEACLTANCSNFFTYNNSQQQQCSELYQFVPGSSTQIVSYEWDFGDGTISTDLSPTHFYTAGIYEVTLTTIDVDQCISTSTQTIICTIGHSVIMSNDTIGCQEAAYLEASTYGGSGDFSYQWFPSTGLSNPTDSITYASGVHNQTYVCEVTDNLWGCIVGGAVTVSSYEAYFDTIYLCGDSVELDLGPGGDFYNWTPYYSNDYETQTIWVDQPGDYFVYATFPSCGALTSNFTVLECPSTCTSSIFNNGITYQNCQTIINLGASYSSPIDSAIWDMGNGTVLFDSGGGIPTQTYEGGNYIVELTAYHTGGCVSTTSYGLTLLTDITAEISAEDTVACAGQLFLNATATGGGGQYTYFWPQSGSTTPSTVEVATQNQWIVVEVLDTYTGCSDSDSIYVYANQQINETIEMCQPSVPLMVNPGSMIYTWSYTDASGNTTNLANQTNELDATNLGTYNCMTYYSGCQQMVHTFEVIQCGTACSSDFIAFPNPQQCGSLYDFDGQNFSSAIDSVVWNYGDGTTDTNNGGGASHFYTAGAYTITMTAYHLSGCISTSSQSITVNGGVTIELIEDTLACNGTLFLNHTISGGSGNYTYEWYPQAAMNDPTAPFPTMTVTADGWVEVYLTDTQQGCVTTDSMYVYANTEMIETLEICTDSIMTVDPGSVFYQWTYNDEFGNTTQVQNVTNEHVANAVGVYICITYYTSCNTITHSFEVVDCTTQNDEVWPGDANSDGVVTNSDALYLGLAFNQTGPNRPGATLNWIGQPCLDWTFDFASNNVNLKHTDCDGNGIINFDDTLAIDFNYQNTHNKFEGVSAGGNPPIWVEASPDTVGLEQAIDIVIHLGTDAQPVDSLHGVAFSLTFDETKLTSNGLSIDYDNCVLGTAGNDVLTFQKNLFNDGMIDFAISRSTLQNFQGRGPIVHARIVTTDNLSGVHAVRFGISGVVALTASENEVELTAIPDTVIIDPTKVGIEENAPSNVLVYPNPATDILNISGLNGTGSIMVFNAVGQEMMTVPFNNSERMKLNLSELVSGVYFIQIRTENGIVTHKLRLIQS
jgi:hypothetical protein